MGGVGKHPLVARWILADRLLNPPQRSLVPPWYLLVILVAVTENTYEPLRLAPPKLLALKVLFLIAAASTRRVSELHALCMDPPFLLENPLSLFWPRTQHPSQRRLWRLHLSQKSNC